MGGASTADTELLCFRTLTPKPKGQRLKKEARLSPAPIRSRGRGRGQGGHPGAPDVARSAGFMLILKLVHISNTYYGMQACLLAFCEGHFDHVFGRWGGLDGEEGGSSVSSWRGGVTSESQSEPSSGGRSAAIYEGPAGAPVTSDLRSKQTEVGPGHMTGDQPVRLTVGRRVRTLPFLDGHVVNGDVSLDARPSDPLYQHLARIPVSLTS